MRKEEAKALRKLAVPTVFDEAVCKVQGKLGAFLAAREQKQIIAKLTASAQEGDHRDAKQLARFLEGGRAHASAWLTAPRSERDCHMANGYFRIAVAVRLGVNPFRGVEPASRCGWCRREVGDDMLSHMIECMMQMAKGDNNRRHQWLQQAISGLLRAVGHGQVQLTPLVLALFGSGSHEDGYSSPVTPLARFLGSSRAETVEQNARRQGDIGAVGVTERDAIELIDITVSDGGGSKPRIGSFVPGQLCEERAKQKIVTYTTRFRGITKKQLVILSFDAMGGMTKETEEWFRHLITLLAGADLTTPPSVVARRTWSRLSVSLQTSIAVNALSFRNGKLLKPSRRVGLDAGVAAESGEFPAVRQGSQPNGPSAPGLAQQGQARQAGAAGPEQGGSRKRTRREQGGTQSLEHCEGREGGEALHRSDTALAQQLLQRALWIPMDMPEELVGEPVVGAVTSASALMPLVGDAATVDPT